MAELVRRAPRAFVPAAVAAALLLAPIALGAALGVVDLPSASTRGLPADWAQRGGWLLVQALAGFGAACALAAGAWWAGRRARQRE